MATVERQLQLCLNNISKWALENGFRFSNSKTNAIHFCSKHKLHNDPELLIDKQPIKVVKEATFLGILFDSKLGVGECATSSWWPWANISTFQLLLWSCSSVRRRLGSW